MALLVILCPVKMSIGIIPNDMGLKMQNKVWKVG